MRLQSLGRNAKAFYVVDEYRCLKLAGSWCAGRYCSATQLASTQAEIADKVELTIQINRLVDEGINSEVENDHLTKEVVVENLLREAIHQRIEDRAYLAYYSERVEAGLADVRAGRVTSHADLMAEFTALQAEVISVHGTARKTPGNA